MIQYPYMEDVSGIGNGMQDTRSQDALHQALLLRSMQMNPAVQHNQQNSNMLAQALRQGNKQNPSLPTDTSNINPATGQDWSATGSGYAGNGGYGIDSIDSWLSGTSGLDNSALGDYNLSGLGSTDLAGSSGLSSIGDFLASLFGSGGAASGAATAIEEAAPVVLAAL